MSARAVREQLARHGLAPRKDLGQNFLTDARVAEQIVALAGVAADDAVIEIGAGLGVLTRALAARARRVTALEIDAGLVRLLRAEGELSDRVELRHVDALREDLAGLAGELGPPVRLVANLPYAVSSPLLRRLLDLRERLVGWLVMIQREVARRLVADPGTRDYGSLTVLHRLTTHCEAVRDVPPECFFPAPQVVSTLVRITPLEQPALSADELPGVERVLRAAFGQRRKTLTNALRGGWPEAPTAEVVHGVLESLGLDARVRAEALAPDVLLDVARALWAHAQSSRGRAAP
ncbi:MAG: 16S rRNA (adenine(1518)-N(6)/adenine(1519)-N(6))-dimethyltransferase RsmA [Myxococcota bacterium]|nr:16S rRNA (adenine(1518)-N(6)/adenine(1519)-N(6))-dimethyltransferase RsmA [Myxococcota bacterium]